MNGTKVGVAMSGGVDSSVTAALLKEYGYDVTGIMMKLWDGDDKQSVKLRQSCYGPGEATNIEDARRTAETIGITLHVIDLSQEFRKEVLDYFNNEYLSGRTPNPCLMCNRKLKFDALINKAKEIGIVFDYFATGHYCRVEYNNLTNRYVLKKGKDTTKDQSYFLAFLSQVQLSRTMFPVGGYTKDEVRVLAEKFGLAAVNRQESQDFIAAGYRSVIDNDVPGVIENSLGELLGEHPGISNFTIGQRKGLGISYPEPLYVTDIDPETGIVKVGIKDEIYADTMTVSQLNWIEEEKPDGQITLDVKIRYAHKGAKAEITPSDDDMLTVTFHEPQMAITPGQAAVFYRDDIVAGAGIINRK